MAHGIRFPRSPFKCDLFSFVALIWLLKPEPVQSFVSLTFNAVAVKSEKRKALCLAWWHHQRNERTVILVCFSHFASSHLISLSLYLSPQGYRWKSLRQSQKTKLSPTEHILSCMHYIRAFAPRQKRSLRTRRKWKPVWHWNFDFLPCAPFLCVPPVSVCWCLFLCQFWKSMHAIFFGDSLTKGIYTYLGFCYYFKKEI